MNSLILSDFEHPLIPSKPWYLCTVVEACQEWDMVVFWNKLCERVMVYVRMYLIGINFIYSNFWADKQESELNRSPWGLKYKSKGWVYTINIIIYKVWCNQVKKMFLHSYHKKYTYLNWEICKDKIGITRVVCGLERKWGKQNEGFLIIITSHYTNDTITSNNNNREN